MAYKISGTSSENSTIYVLQNNALIGYKENNYVDYDIVFDSSTPSGVIAVAASSEGEIEGYGNIVAIVTGDSSNIIEPNLGGLLKTGQTTSYVAGDDGDLEIGIAKSYTDNGDGTVTDDNTGLMWAKDGNGAGCNNGNTLTWAAALSYANGLDFAGYTDWRLPNIFELFSICLLEVTHGAPYIDTTYFPNTANAYYWSSTTYPNDTDRVLAVYFGTGYMSSRTKTSSNYARCVRGGV